MLAALACLAVAAAAADWQTSEAAHLRNIRQVTHDFVRAGEGYFSPDGKQIIFQAEEQGSGNPFYQIFVMDLELWVFHPVSPGPGRTSCSCCRPDDKRNSSASSHRAPHA